MITTTSLLSCLCLATALWLGFQATRLPRWRPALLCALLLLWLLLTLAHRTADHFTGNGIDESVLFHLWVGMEGAGVADYLPVIVGVLIALPVCVATVVLAWRAYMRRAGRMPASSWQRNAAGAGLTLGVAAIALHPATAELGQLARMHARVMNAQPVPSAHFVPPPAPLPLAAPRNLVVLYLESAERTYLDQTLFPGLMPRLAALEQRALSFTNLHQVYGTGWTIAGMAASQCGLPLVTPGDANSMSGADQFLPGARCLGDVLQAAGYDLHFLGGADLDFAGKGTFYRTHGFTHVSGRDELQPGLPDPDYVAPWGLYDDSLLDIGRQTFDRLSVQDQPFGLFLLTLDTHPPAEHLSATCPRPGKNPMLDAMRCADRMAAAFIGHIIDGPHASNTLVVVLSDHLAMRNSAWNTLEKGERRNLAMVFHPDLPPARIERAGSTLDIAPTVLGLLGNPTPGFGYGRDLLAPGPTLVEAPEDVDDQLMSDRPFLASLWDHPQLFNGLAVDTGARTATLGRRTIRYPALLLLDDQHRVTDIRYPFYSDKGLNEHVAELDSDTRFVWIDHCRLLQPLHRSRLREGTCLASGSLDQTDLSVDVLEGPAHLAWPTLKARLTAPGHSEEHHLARLDGLNQWRHYGADQVVTYQGNTAWQGQLVVRSSAYGNDPSEVRSDARPTPQRLPNGLTLLGLDARGRPHMLGVADICPADASVRHREAPSLRGSLAQAIARHRQRYGTFIVVAHFPQTGSVCEPGDLSHLFERSGLSQWHALDGTRPYIGLLTADGTQEFTGEPLTSLALDLSQGQPY